MKNYLLSFNPVKGCFSDWPEAARRTRAGQPYADTWRVRSGKINTGDQVFVLKQGSHPRGIVASGRATSSSYNGFANRDGSGPDSKRIDVEFDVVLDVSETPLPWPLINRRYEGKFKGPFGSGIEVAQDLAQDLARQWTDWLKRIRP